MTYVVLARKYRPSTFAELVGQEPIVRTLRNAMAMGRVHHAFLLTGARGVGKTTTARLLAKSLNCAEGPTISPCGRCASCEEVGRGASSGVVEIDGASHTGVDNVRELRESARYVPQVGRYKVYIVDEVHMLSQAAFNALLKLLEEPPAHVKFVFATTEPHKIPATILSRCQRFDFRRLDVATLATHLGRVLEREGVAMADTSLQAIARQAGGSVRDALSLLDQVLSYAGGDASPQLVREALGAVDNRVLFSLTDAVVGRDAEAMLQLLADLEAQGHELSLVAELFVEHLRDVAVAQAGVGPRALAHRTEAEVEELRRQAAQRSAGDWQRLFDKACDVAQGMRGAGTAKVALEMGLLRLMHVAPAADLADLLRRVDALLAALPEGGGPTEGAPPGTGSRAASRSVAARGGPGGPRSASAEGEPVSREVPGAGEGAAHSEMASRGAGAARQESAAPGRAAARAEILPPHVASASGEGDAFGDGATSAKSAARGHGAAAAAAAAPDGGLAANGVGAPGADTSLGEAAGTRPPPAPATAAQVAAPRAGEEPVTASPEAHPTSAFVTSPTLTHAPELAAGERACGSDGGGRDAGAEVGQNDATCGFRTFVERVRRARPSLASVLEHGQLVHFGADEVVLAFAPDTFWWDAATDADNRTLFEAQLKGQLAARVGWRIVPLEQGGHARPTLAQQREADAKGAWEKTRAEAADHAAVRAATHILGAAIEDIRPAPQAQAQL